MTKPQLSYRDLLRIKRDTSPEEGGKGEEMKSINLDIPETAEERAAVALRAERDESKNWQELANGWQQQSNKFESERDQLKAQLDEAVKLLPRLRAHICELTRVREKYVDSRGNEDFREAIAEIDSVLAKVKGEK